MTEQPLLIRNHSQASSDAQEFLAHAEFEVRIVVVDDIAEDLPVLVTGLGRFIGLDRIKGYVQLEKNGFNKYANALLTSRISA